MLKKGLNDIVENLYPAICELPSGETLSIQIEDASIRYPGVPLGTIGVKNTNIYPSECRQRAATYKAKMVINVCWSINGRKQPSFEKDMGEIPIMIRVIVSHSPLFFFFNKN